MAKAALIKYWDEKKSQNDPIYTKVRANTEIGAASHLIAQYELEAFELERSLELEQRIMH